MSILDIFGGGMCLITGVEDQPDGSLKVYVGPRYKGIYTLVDDPAEQDKVRRAWSDGRSHVFTSIPPVEALFCDDETPAAGPSTGPNGEVRQP